MKMQPVDNPSNETIDILLRPGDVLALSKEARYQWEHGIEETLVDTYHSELIERKTRISVTLRKLNQTEEGSHIQTAKRY
jgi:alkylated DNA repair dioxygenase AlkB